MTKLRDGMTQAQVVTKLGNGNAGAMSAVVDIIKHKEATSTLLQLLDEFEIYGTDLYILYNDKCRRDVRKLHLLMLGAHLNIIHAHELTAMSKDQRNNPLLSFTEAMCEKFETIIKVAYAETQEGHDHQGVKQRPEDAPEWE